MPGAGRGFYLEFWQKQLSDLRLRDRPRGRLLFHHVREKNREDFSPGTQQFREPLRSPLPPLRTNRTEKRMLEDAVKDTAEIIFSQQITRNELYRT